MLIRITRSLCVATAIAAMLCGCGGASEDKKAKADPCADLKEQVKAAGEQANGAFSDYNKYTDGRGFGSGTAEGQNLGEHARQAMLTFLHLVTNSPDCFSATEVAQAQSLLTTWEKPGTVPAPTATSGTGDFDR